MKRELRVEKPESVLAVETLPTGKVVFKLLELWG
jgi:hypothetical protein